MSENADIIEESTVTVEVSDTPNVLTLPPFLLLIALMAGIVLNWLIPMSFGRAADIFGWLGFIMLSLSVGALFWSGKSFKEVDTPLSPREPTTSIVTDGLYQFSRNPIYVCFLFAFIGLSFMADAPMMLLLAIPLFFVLDYKIIRPEEDYLAEKFGEEYLSYKKQVRRWL